MQLLSVEAVLLTILSMNCSAAGLLAKSPPISITLCCGSSKKPPPPAVWVLRWFRFAAAGSEENTQGK
jgi:hypothetical protein